MWSVDITNQKAVDFFESYNYFLEEHLTPLLKKAEEERNYNMYALVSDIYFDFRDSSEDFLCDVNKMDIDYGFFSEGRFENIEFDKLSLKYCLFGGYGLGRMIRYDNDNIAFEEDKDEIFGIAPMKKFYDSMDTMSEIFEIEGSGEKLDIGNDEFVEILGNLLHNPELVTLNFHEYLIEGNPYGEFVNVSDNLGRNAPKNSSFVWDLLEKIDLYNP